MLLILGMGAIRLGFWLGLCKCIGLMLASLGWVISNRLYSRLHIRYRLINWPINQNVDNSQCKQSQSQSKPQPNSSPQSSPSPYLPPPKPSNYHPQLPTYTTSSSHHSQINNSPSHTKYLAHSYSYRCLLNTCMLFNMCRCISR